jgi:hypothetical protein
MGFIDDLDSGSVIAFKVPSLNLYLRAPSTQPNGCDRLELSEHNDSATHFRIRKYNNDTISLQSACGGFVSPSKENKWTCVPWCRAWEFFNIESFSSHTNNNTDNNNNHDHSPFNRYIQIATRIPNKPVQYLSVEQQGLNDKQPYTCVLSNTPFMWEITLVEVPTIYVSELLRNQTNLMTSSHPNQLTDSVLSVVKKITRAHKEMGFFHIIGHGVNLELFSIIQTYVGAQPYMENTKVSDDERKKH